MSCSKFENKNFVVQSENISSSHQKYASTSEHLQYSGGTGPRVPNLRRKTRRNQSWLEFDLLLFLLSAVGLRRSYRPKHWGNAMNVPTNSTPNTPDFDMLKAIFITSVFWTEYQFSLQ